MRISDWSSDVCSSDLTDFGVPKVIGGQFDVLATDIYKQVVGQQNFQMGAVVGVVLLLPAVLAFVGDRLVQRRQAALLSARAVPLIPKPNRATDLRPDERRGEKAGVRTCRTRWT